MELSKKASRFQVEVPESASKKVPSSWEVQSQRKGFVRYYFPEARKLKADLEKAEIRFVILKETQSSSLLPRYFWFIIII